MSLIRLECPHCGTQAVAFTVIGAVKFQDANDVWTTFCFCNRCTGGVVLQLFDRDSVDRNPAERTGALEPLFSITDSWPKIEALAAPEHVPENIAKFFVQGLDNLRRKNFDAAGIMFRKSLDASIKQIKPAAKGDLKSRIDALATEYAITPAMREWAQHIRLGGNDAAHEEEPYSGDDTAALHTFTQMFLLYTYTLPAMLPNKETQRKK